MTCIVTATETKIDSSYLGWKNYETWNVALWLSNDAGLYDLARQYRHWGYDRLAVALAGLGVTETPDGVAYDDSDIDVEALDQMLEDDF